MFKEYIYLSQPTLPWPTGLCKTPTEVKQTNDITLSDTKQKPERISTNELGYSDLLKIYRYQRQAIAFKCNILSNFLCQVFSFPAPPESPSCTVREDTESGDIKSVTVSCSTSKVYPKARCRFYRTKDVSHVLWLYRLCVVCLVYLTVIRV